MSGALIVTALLDEVSQAGFETERRLHFPPEKNLIPAHVTLFHALPGEEMASVLRTLETLCRGQATARFETRGLMFLGRGVAYALDMPEVAGLRDRLAAAWRGWLTRQDAQPFRPHVTVQNKVSPEAARTLLATLQADYAPWRGEVLGLALWRYEGGPWTALAKVYFGRER